jgi:hypothetical protein
MKWLLRFFISVFMTSSCGQDPAFNDHAVPDLSGDTQNSGDATAGTGVNQGSADTDPTQNGSPYTPPLGYPAGTPRKDVLVEDGGSNVIPGIKATKVGINFEDLSDFDYNDSVLCFSGNLKIEGTKVVSYMKQEIHASVWSNSACGHYIDVQVKSPAGVVTQSFRYSDRTTTAATINFDVGSELYVTMVNFPNQVCKGSVPQSNTTYAKVVPNICNR